MKSLNKSVVLSLISAILAPVALVAQAGSVAQVLSEDPDGAVVVRAGSTMAVDAGDALQEGDHIKTNAATLIVSIADGALLTLYPRTEVILTTLGKAEAEISLKSGELLGDSISGYRISVANPVGEANISSGVYGVVLNRAGDGWTLQVRNLDGNVSFTGADSLNTNNMAASLLQSGKTVDVPVGQEMIVRGIYDAGADVFALSSGGVAMAMIPDGTAGNMRGGASRMSAVSRGLPVGGPATPAEEVPAVEMIEIPFEEVETASDKG